MNDKRKVLICDDDEILLEITKRVLEKENFIVESLSTMIHLIKKAEDFRPDVILMDLSMPNMSGAEAISILRANSRTQNLPVVFFSANPRLQIIAKEYKTQFIQKPFQIKELRKLLRSIEAKVS